MLIVIGFEVMTKATEVAEVMGGENIFKSTKRLGETTWNVLDKVLAWIEENKHSSKSG